MRWYGIGIILVEKVWRQKTTLQQLCKSRAYFKILQSLSELSINDDTDLYISQHFLMNDYFGFA